MSERKSPSSGRGGKQTPKRRGGGAGDPKHGSSAASSGLLLKLKLSDLNAAGAVQSGVGETHVMPTGSPSRPADMYRWDIHSELSTTEMKRASSTSQLGGGGAAGGGSASGNGNGGGGGGVSNSVPTPEPSWSDTAKAAGREAATVAGPPGLGGLESKMSPKKPRHGGAGGAGGAGRAAAVGSWEWRQRKKAYRDEVDSRPLATPLDPAVFVP